MKGIVCVGALSCLLYSCSFSDEIQVEAVNVKLVEIDTLARSNRPIKLLTWMSSNHVRYVTTADLSDPVSVGTEMHVLTKR